MNPDRGTVDGEGARLALHRGAAVVLPNPAPLTCTVAGTDPLGVNRAKGRPAEQAVALWAHHRDTLAALEGVLDLDTGLTEVVHGLLVAERVTVLVPLRNGVRGPDWLAPASRDGWTLLFGARWAPLLPVLSDLPVLYVSSANRTGRPPAGTAAEAVAMFPADVPVLGAGSLPGADRPDGRPRAATSTVRLHPDGRLELHRRGAHDRAFADPERFLDRLRETYRTPGAP